VNRGYLIITSDFTKAAEELVEHTKGVTVYDRMKFNRLLVGEKI
jgi:hypothetical protein